MKHLIFILVLPIFASADPPKVVKSLNIVYQKGKSIFVREVSYGEKTPDISVDIVSPHRYKNPDKKLAKWSGLKISKILEDIPQSGGDVVVAGASGYSTEFPETILRNHSIFIALQRDNKALMPADGGPQLVYPLNDPKLPATLTNDAWWVWFVSAIILGKLDPLIQISDPTQKSMIDLRAVAGAEKIKTRPCYPAGQRMNQPPREKIEWTYVPLKSILPNGHRTQAIITTYVNKKVSLEKEMSNYVLGYAWNGKSIPPAFGGPVVGFWKDKPTECLSFVSKVEFSQQ